MSFTKILAKCSSPTEVFNGLLRRFCVRFCETAAERIDWRCRRFPSIFEPRNTRNPRNSSCVFLFRVFSVFRGFFQFGSSSLGSGFGLLPTFDRRPSDLRYASLLTPPGNAGSPFKFATRHCESCRRYTVWLGKAKSMSSASNRRFSSRFSF